MQFLFKISLKKTWALIYLFFTLLAFSGCQDKPLDLGSTQNTNSFNETVLKFVVTPWPPDAINYLAKELGFFDKYGVNAEIVWADDYKDIFDELDKNNLDVWTSTFPEALKYKSETGVGKIVFLEDISVGADAVVTLGDENIQSISDLAGKKVGVEDGTVSEFFLQVLLDRQGVQFSDLEMLNIPSAGILEELKNGGIDVGVCYEPCPSNTLNQGGKILIDSSKERGLIVDFYVVKEDHFEKNRDLYLKAFMAISDAQEYFNQNPEKSMEIMKEILNLSTEEIAASFSKIAIPGFHDNQAAFNRSSGFNSLYNLANVAGQYLEYRDLIEVGFDTDQLINPELVEAIIQQVGQP